MIYLNERVKDCINRVYLNKDYRYFKEKSKQSLVYLDELINLVDSKCEKINILSLRNSPSVELMFDFKKYANDQFNVEYRTILKISKIANIFFLQHEFSVDNLDPDKMMPNLNGFGGESYTISQSKLDKEITYFLEKKGVQKLQIFEIDEVIYGLKMPEESIFGNQMKVEDALFRDLYDICEE